MSSKRELRRIVTAFALAATAVGIGVAASSSASASPPTGSPAVSSSPEVTWTACPQYSDAVLTYLRIRPTDFTRFRAMLDRMKCGTVSVPLDYADPDGQRITIAFTDLPATDQAHRLGTLAMNPGGPGGSGYLMPETLSLENATDAQLSTQYDLIGLDPRGTGYSTSYTCAQEWDPISGSLAVGRQSAAEVRAYYDDAETQAKACSTSDPAFLSQLTTANAARDLEQIRLALHEPTMSYFGASWGTQLGAVYRSLFPRSVGRMWLDSVVSPDSANLEYRFSGSAAETEKTFALFADWLARHDSEYGLGDTPGEVTATVLKMRQAADAEPWQFTNVPVPLGGSFISYLAAATNLQWSQAAEALSAMKTAVNGSAAPSAVTSIVGEGSSSGTAPAGAPAQFNDTAQQAYMCNEDTSSRSFDALWANYQSNLQKDPITGDITALRPTCAGWTLPTSQVPLRAASGSLVMSAHVYEASTPYAWALLMQRRIGGTVFTVDDFIHGSADVTPACESHIVTYFDTGSTGGAGCPGEQPGTVDDALLWTGA